MDKTIHFTLPIKIEKLLAFFLLMYPLEYRKKFGNEIVWVFSQMYDEEIHSKGKAEITFLILQFGDIAKSVLEQHFAVVQKKGIKKYLVQTLHITRYNIAGGILLLPFGILFTLDFLGRLVQGDFTRYNRAWYAAITQSVLYREPIVIRALLIYAPLAAVIINITPLLQAVFSTNRITVRKLLFTSPFAILIIVLGLGFLGIVYGHDVIPCTIHGILSHGLLQLPKILTVCKNA